MRAMAGYLRDRRCSLKGETLNTGHSVWVEEDNEVWSKMILMVTLGLKAMYARSRMPVCQITYGKAGMVDDDLRDWLWSPNRLHALQMTGLPGEIQCQRQ